MIIAEKNSTKRELIPAGNYISVCYAMLNIGTVPTEYLGVKKHLNKIRITFELSNELRDFGKGLQPMSISSEYTLSLAEKSNLKKILEGWRGKAFTEIEIEKFDITKLLGLHCLLNIIHNEKGTYEVISSISQIPKGMEIPKRINPILEWNYTDHFDLEVLSNFPDFIKDKIKSSKEWKLYEKSLSENAKITETVFTANSENTDDIPF